MKRRILLGISGGIAVFKAAQLVSNLSKRHEVRVIMTENALEFMSPLTFETLTGHKVYKSMFGPEADQTSVAHIELAKWAEIIILAPCTANVIAKAAAGLADDLLSTMLLAARSPILLCPAMNSFMLAHPATQANLKTLSARGFHILDSDEGLLACGDFGSGKLPAPEVIEQKAMEILDLQAEGRKDLEGLRITVTAGPTQEALDPVRFVSNHSSGKMGYAIASEAAARGADVTLISGPVSLEPPSGVRLVKTVSALDMFEAVKNYLPQSDILIKAAAVGDYRPAEQAEEKIKKKGDELLLRLVPNPDILAWAGAHKTAQTVLCGFAMETEDLLKNARAKLEKKNCDLLAANSLRQEGAGFGVNTNIATLLWRDREEQLPLMSKADLASRILDECLKLHKEKSQC